MIEFKNIKIYLDCETPALSQIFINEKKILNIEGLKISADAHGKFTIELETYGDKLDDGSSNFMDVYIHPKCPACGHKPPPYIGIH